MPPSRRLRSLQKRMTELRKHFLPKSFSPTGVYTERVQDHSRGYRLLAHAEIESYLEDICRTVVTDRVSAWKQERTPSNLLLAFLACYHSGWVDYDDDHKFKVIEMARSRKGVKEAVEEIIDQAQRQFIQHLQENHGIRLKNIKTLVLPTGIDLKDLDETWIIDLDDFGKQRGLVAHGAKGTIGTMNPQDEFIRVGRLMKGLAELDKKLTALR